MTWLLIHTIWVFAGGLGYGLAKASKEGCVSLKRLTDSGEDLFCNVLQIKKKIAIFAVRGGITAETSLRSWKDTRTEDYSLVLLYSFPLI